MKVTAPTLLRPVPALLIAALLFSQTACYNSYFIDKGELEKLESTPDPREVVDVYADCASGAPAATPAKPGDKKAYRALVNGQLYAAAAADDKTASDATATASERPDCVKVPVSTANSVKVLTNDGRALRVTPFNFIMSETQLVSPEYDLLQSLKDVKGAEVKQFSTAKTVLTITGVTVGVVGAFVLISVLAPAEQGF